MNFNKYYKMPNNRQRGFTLVELLLVLVILALIAGLVLPGIIGKAESAKAKAASSQISRISMSVESFYLDTGNTPSSLEELVNQPSGVTGWNGPYIKNSLLKDPWGQPYKYSVPGEHGDFDIESNDGFSGCTNIQALACPDTPELELPSTNSYGYWFQSSPALRPIWPAPAS